MKKFILVLMIGGGLTMYQQNAYSKGHGDDYGDDYNGLFEWTSEDPRKQIMHDNAELANKNNELSYPGVESIQEQSEKLTAIWHEDIEILEETEEGPWIDWH